MSKSRYVVLGMFGLCAGAGVVVGSMPQTWRLIRHERALHRHVRFGDTVASSVVPIAKAMAPVVAADLDLRFVGQGLSDFAAPRLLPPRLEAAHYAPPTITAAKTTTAASPLDQNTSAVATATKTDDSSLAADLAGARQALRHYHDGDVAGGDDFARLTNGSLRTALDWAAIRLASRQAGPDRLRAFIAAHADWPQGTWINRRIEESRSAVRDPVQVLAMFASSTPETLTGKLSLARAKLATGDSAGAAAVVQAVWRNDDLTPAEEATVLRDFGSVLHREDHKFRADRLLYKETIPPALHAAQLAGPDVLLLAKARAAVTALAPADAAIVAVPKPLQNDPGLIYAKLQKARRAGRIDEAAGLMLAAPTAINLLVDGDAWWVERRLLARKLLDAGRTQTAYQVVAAHSATSNALRIEAEFHAGWIALRFMNDPALAAPHFAAVSAMAETPISAARGAYWQGRAAEALGNDADAARFYAAASSKPTTFYGQLAAARAGHGPLALRQPASVAQGPERREAIRCVELLFALGERELATSLAFATARSEPDEAQVAALAEVVEATQDARTTLVVGKTAAQRGMAIDEAAFPTFGVPGYQPLDRSADRPTVFAIARQESEFDPHSVSSAGAKGLMQVIDSTARQTAEHAGVRFDEARMLTDAAFNAQIGAAHLGKLLSEQDGSYILTFAAYNAGSRKVQEWIAAYGDPRKPGVDPIDWIERIPFTETRNYVQRVFENMQIYRVRFGIPTALLSDPKAGSDGKRT